MLAQSILLFLPFSTLQLNAAAILSCFPAMLNSKESCCMRRCIMYSVYHLIALQAMLLFQSYESYDHRRVNHSKLSVFWARRPSRQVYGSKSEVHRNTICLVTKLTWSVRRGFCLLSFQRGVWLQILPPTAILFLIASHLQWKDVKDLDALCFRSMNTSVKPNYCHFCAPGKGLLAHTAYMLFILRSMRIVWLNVFNLPFFPEYFWDVDKQDWHRLMIVEPNWCRELMSWMLLKVTYPFNAIALSLYREGKLMSSPTSSWMVQQLAKSVASLWI